MKNIMQTNIKTVQTKVYCILFMLSQNRNWLEKCRLAVGKFESGTSSIKLKTVLGQTQEWTLNLT